MNQIPDIQLSDQEMSVEGRADLPISWEERDNEQLFTYLLRCYRESIHGYVSFCFTNSTHTVLISK